MHRIDANNSGMLMPTSDFNPSNAGSEYIISCNPKEEKDQ